MLQTRSRLLCATVLAGLLCIAIPSAQAADTVSVAGNISSWAVPANKIGPASDTLSTEIAVHMVLNNPEGLRSFVAAVSKPGSATYGHYLTHHEFLTAFAPRQADVEAVRTLLQKAGMTGVAIGPANAYVLAHATVAQLRATFGVSQNLYRFNGRTLRANAEAPSIPAALSGKVLFIEGLDDSAFLKHPFHKSATASEARPVAATTAPGAVTPPPVVSQDPSPYCSTYFGDHKAVLSTQPAPYSATQPWLLCGYTPQQIRQAYGLNKVSYAGTGISVAIVDAYASPTLQADGNRYAANHALPPLRSYNFSEIIPAGIYNVNPNDSCGPTGWWTEQSLDIAAVHGSAPGASIVFVGSEDCGTSLDIAFLNTVYNLVANIVTNSWGNNGEAVPAGSFSMFDQAGMAAAAQGQTVLFSSGDDGDLLQVNGVASGSFPATGAYVTAVGGTSLALYGAGGFKNEWGWGTDRDFLAGATVNSATSVTTSGLTTASNFGYTYADFSYYSGSGGGISFVEPQPSYQMSAVPALLATSINEASGYSVILPNPMRVAPDVAMVADPYTGYLYGESYTIAGNYSDTGCTPTSSTTEYCEIDEGGTSLASPLMAGMMAVVDQARMATGRPLVGFANPWLYSLSIGSTLTSAGINDVSAPAVPTSVLRGYVSNLNEVRLVTINSVPFDIFTSPLPIVACGATICEGINDVFNYTTPGYDDVTGLGVPYAPNLIND